MLDTYGGGEPEIRGCTNALAQLNRQRLESHLKWQVRVEIYLYYSNALALCDLSELVLGGIFGCLPIR